MKKSIWKKLTALLLTAALAVGLVPSAFAAVTVEYQFPTWVFGYQALNEAAEPGYNEYMTFYPAEAWAERWNIEEAEDGRFANTLAAARKLQNTPVTLDQRTIEDMMMTQADADNLDNARWVLRDMIKVPENVRMGLSDTSARVVYWYDRTISSDNISTVNWNNGVVTLKNGSTVVPFWDSSRKEDEYYMSYAAGAAIIGGGAALIVGTAAIIMNSAVVSPRRVKTDAADFGLNAKLTLNGSASKTAAVREVTGSINVEPFRILLSTDTNAPGQDVVEVVLPLKTLGRESFCMVRLAGSNVTQLPRLTERPATVEERQENTWCIEDGKAYLYTRTSGDFAMGYDGIMAVLF